MATKTIIIMSDSHGDRAIVEAIKARYEGQVDAIFHNGDSELPSDDPVWSGIHVVRGNCDYDSGYPDSNTVELDGLTLAQTHGHLQQINFTWQYLDLFAEEKGARICLYGHLHRPTAWENEGTLFINPGSVSQPRGEVQERLYARVTLDEQKIKVDYLTRDHKLYPSLSKEFSR